MNKKGLSNDVIRLMGICVILLVGLVLGEGYSNKLKKQIAELENELQRGNTQDFYVKIHFPDSGYVDIYMDQIPGTTAYGPYRLDEWFYVEEGDCTPVREDADEYYYTFGPECNGDTITLVPYPETLPVKINGEELYLEPAQGQPGYYEIPSTEDWAEIQVVPNAVFAGESVTLFDSKCDIDAYGAGNVRVSWWCRYIALQIQ